MAILSRIDWKVTFVLRITTATATATATTTTT